MAGIASRLCQGVGWRFGWNGEQGLIGGDDWALELTAEEWQDWCCTCRNLWDTWQAMQAHLMPEEDLTLERQTDLLTMNLFVPAALALVEPVCRAKLGNGTCSPGSPPQVRLYVQLCTGRVAEGQWQGESAQTLLARMAALGEGGRSSVTGMAAFT